MLFEYHPILSGPWSVADSSATHPLKRSNTTLDNLPAAPGSSMMGSHPFMLFKIIQGYEPGNQHGTHKIKMGKQINKKTTIK